MLRKTKDDILGFTLGAIDGEIGRAKDLYFDDQSWTVRYLVADTCKWLTLRQVLISPFAVQGFRDADKVVPLNLTRAQIKGSPSIDEDAPLSRQFELEYYGYYGWPLYWQGPGLWGPSALPVPGLGTVTPAAERLEHHGDTHLRSVSEVKGYHFEALDGEIGHVEDFILDDQDWVIRYLVADTRNWWPGKKVLLPPAWATNVDWARSSVHVNLAREVIKGAPEYDPSVPISRGYEASLFDYYSRQPYWEHRLAA